MAAHARLKKGFTEDGKYHNLMGWLICTNLTSLQFYCIQVRGIPHTVSKTKILHECEVRIEKSARGSLFGITKLRRVMPNSDPEGRIFQYAPNNHDRFFFLHTF